MVEPIDTSTLGPIRIEPGVGPHGDLDAREKVVLAALLRPGMYVGEQRMDESTNAWRARAIVAAMFPEPGTFHVDMDTNVAVMAPHPDRIIGEIIRNWLEGRFELMEADVFPDLMVKAGYARKVGFDPDKHEDEHDYAPDPGDPWYELTDAGIKARDTQ